jgi:hypothetical protein
MVGTVVVIVRRRCQLQRVMLTMAMLTMAMLVMAIPVMAMPVVVIITREGATSVHGGASATA